MKFTIERGHLLELLNKVIHAVDSKGTILTLRYLKLVAGQDLRLSATDLHVSIEARTQACTVQAPFATAVLAGAFRDVVAAMPAGELTISLGTNLCIARGRSKFNLGVISLYDFPLIPNYDSLSFVTVPFSGFKQLIPKVAYCASHDQARPVINAVCINETDIVATDGHRMAVAKNTFLPGQKPLLIPAKACAIVSKILGDDGVGFYQGATEVHFRDKSTFITTRLVEGAYPNYTAVLPQTAHDTATVNKAELMAVLQRVMITSAILNAVQFIFEPGKLTLASKTDWGNSDETIECVSAGGHTFQVNGKYFLELLSHLTRDTVTMELRGPKTPIVCREENYATLVMPQSGARASTD